MSLGMRINQSGFPPTLSFPCSSTQPPPHQVIIQMQPTEGNLQIARVTAERVRRQEPPEALWVQPFLGYREPFRVRCLARSPRVMFTEASQSTQCFGAAGPVGGRAAGSVTLRPLKVSLSLEVGRSGLCAGRTSQIRSDQIGHSSQHSLIAPVLGNEDTLSLIRIVGTCWWEQGFVPLIAISTPCRVF